MRMTSRRQFLIKSAIFGAAGLLSSCAPAATPTAEAVPTQAPAANTPPQATATSAPPANPNDPWSIYQDTDGRHWLLKDRMEPAKKYDNLEISTFVQNSGTVFKEGESSEDNVVLRWMKDVMGVQWKVNYTGDLNNYWPTAMASGDLVECMPIVSGSIAAQLLEAGAVEDITDIWEKTASPLQKKNRRYGAANGKAMWDYVKVNGRIMGIPWYNPLTASSNIFYARQDFLDKVGMQFPTTIDEIYQFGTAIVKQGLSQYGIWFNNIYNGPMWGDMSMIFGAYGIPPRIWKRTADGKLNYTSLLDTIKPALETLAKWFKEGLIQPEFLSTPDVGKAVGGNLVGMFPGAYWMVGWPMPDSIKNDPNAKWVWGGLPAGPDGKRGRGVETGVGFMSCFKKGIDPKKVEAYIETHNWIMAMCESAEAPNSIPGWAFKGYDYDVDADGKVVIGKYNTQDAGAGGCDDYAMRYGDIQVGAAQRIAALAKRDRKTLNPYQEYILYSNPWGLMQASTYTLSVSIPEEQNYADEFYWLLPTSMGEVQTALNNLEAEAYASIITGKKDLSSFDTFVSDWKKQGGDDLTKAVNDIADQQKS